MLKDLFRINLEKTAIFSRFFVLYSKIEGKKRKVYYFG